jgi:carbonic anhydrase
MTDANSQQGSALSPELALQELIAGNRRYALGAGIHPHQTLNRRDEIESAQHPFAIIIGCSDSRVPPEIIFDCGLGDLFVARSAGHVLDTAILASVQYAIEHLGVKLILVLGHSNCGAVKAAMESSPSSGPLEALLNIIRPSTTKAANSASDPLDRAVIANICMTLDQLKKIEWAEKVVIQGACYSLKSGLITLNPGI